MTKYGVSLLAAVILCAAVPDRQTEKEILATMEAYKQAFIAKDTGALARILSDDLTYTHSSTQHQDKAAVLASLRGSAVIEAMDFRNVNLRVYGDSAVLTCDIDSRSNNSGVVSLSSLHVIHVLVKGAQGWQVVARQATRSPEPPAGKK